MATIVEDWLAYLERNGSRVTLSTRAVVEVAATSTRALRSAQLLARVRARHPGVSQQTVNRTLARLIALGLIQRVQDGEGQLAYLAAGPDGQALVICERCGEVEYVECPTFLAIFEEIRQLTGFALRAPCFPVFGVCAHCQLAGPAA